MADYFALLGLSPHFDIDMASLEMAYFREQRNYHPDRFIGKPPIERQAAMQRSVDINQAWEMLKNPLLRAQYLLRGKNIIVGTDKDTLKPSPALLMETMEWREQIESLHDLKKADELDSLLLSLQEKVIAEISNNYKNGHFDKMAEQALRLSYIFKAREAITQQKQKLKKTA